MFATSQDILYFVISFCVLWVTFFLCWTLYYLARLLKNTNQIVEEFRSRLEALAESVDYVRGKVENLSQLITLISSGVGGLVQKVVKKKANDWLDDSTESLNESAKEAVDKAVAATARKMGKAVRAMKR